MKTPRTLAIDGNQAAAEIAHLTNKVIAIYPITPAPPMGKWADEWSSCKQPNLWCADALELYFYYIAGDTDTSGARTL